MKPLGSGELVVVFGSYPNVELSDTHYGSFHMGPKEKKFCHKGEICLVLNAYGDDYSNAMYDNIEVLTASGVRGWAYAYHFHML